MRETTIREVHRIGQLVDDRNVPHGDESMVLDGVIKPNVFAVVSNVKQYFIVFFVDYTSGGRVSDADSAAVSAHLAHVSQI